MDFLSGTKVLEEIDSPINGRIKVVKSLGLGTYIQVDNLTQSGGVVYEVWRTVLKKISHQPLTVNHCLILGLGGGSAAKLVKKFWPEAEITGIDIDTVMVELGKKYLGLSQINVVIGDAKKFVTNCKEKYDLVLVDTYLGDKFPKKFESDEFLKSVRRLLFNGGIAVFNRLYFGEKRPEAVKFGKRLEKVFEKVKYVYPEANIMFVASSATI
jgi:spermidine synthase